MTADSIEKTAQLMTCKLCRFVVERTRSGACPGWPCPARSAPGGEDVEALLRVPPGDIVLSGSEMAAGAPYRPGQRRVPGPARPPRPVLEPAGLPEPDGLSPTMTWPRGETARPDPATADTSAARPSQHPKDTRRPRPACTG